MCALATRESVFKACDDLLSKGEYPSARSVVARTKGSLSTVGPLRDEWWAQLSNTYRAGKFLEGVPPDISVFLIGVWKAACEHASRCFEAESATFKQSLEDARLAHEKEVARVFEAESALSRERHQTRHLEDRVAELESSHAILSTQHAASIDAHRLELAALVQTHADKLAAVQASAADTSRAHAEEIARYEEERRRLMLQVDVSRQESIRVSEASLSAAAQHQAAIQASAQRLDQLSTHNHEMSASLAASRVEASSLAAQLAAAQSHAAQLGVERDTLNSRLQAAEALLESQAKTISDQVQASRDFNITLAGFQTLLSPQSRSKPNQTRAARQK